jgi:hypothetical protein
MGVDELLVCVFVVRGFPAVSIPYVREWESQIQLFFVRLSRMPHSKFCRPQ